MTTAENLRPNGWNLSLGVSSSGFRIWCLRFVCILYLVSCNLFLPTSLRAAEDSKKDVTPPSGSSQHSTSRTELWKQRRLQKRKTATPEGPTVFGKSFLWFERRGLEQIQKMNYGGVYLRMGNLAQRSAFALGVRTWPAQHWGHLVGSPGIRCLLQPPLPELRSPARESATGSS